MSPEEITTPEEKGREPKRGERFVNKVLSPFEARAFRDLRDTYLEEGEEVIDYIPETLIPVIDFRWIILTDRRLVFMIRRLFETHFEDMRFDEGMVEFELRKGPLIFDQLRFEKFSDRYTAQFYSYNRDHLVRFISEIEEEIKLKQANPKEESMDAIRTLNDLAELREKGIISKKEFEEKKKKYIDEI